jgi:predicted dehydrogenase
MERKDDYVDRRQFLSKGVKVASVAATTLSSLSAVMPSNAANNRKLKIVLVGTGIRGTRTWGKKLIDSFKEYIKMVALCDINPKRLKFAKQYMKTDASLYLAKDFDKMIKEKKPDTVIVTTPDCFHVQYAIRAMELGCNVIVEKPLATEADQCQALLDKEIQTGKKVITTFNARHGSSAEEIKKFILSGELGRIISAEYYEYLDIYHGASYFRRWHGKARYSGTLLVHKASHHFDQINWWLDADPVEVHAFGKVDFYGSNNAFRARNCRTCKFTKDCKFYWDVTERELYKKLYIDCEDADGYLRDGCVWDNEIDTYDSMTVEVRYNNGVLLSYTLNAFMPYEGQKIAFNGTNGRLDIRNYHRQPWEVEDPATLRYTQNFGQTRTWTTKRVEGEHGGADLKLKKLLFIPGQSDPLSKLADSRAGIISSLIGIAARKSIETGKRIKIDDLIKFPLKWKW